MKHSKKICKGAVALAALLLMTLLPACKGRTMENMTPNGDTVELVPDTIPADSLR